MRMTTYHSDDFELGLVFAEMSFVGGADDREIIVLLCDDRPVGLCFVGHRIVLSKEIEDFGTLANDVMSNWAEDLDRMQDHAQPEYHSQDELEDLIYGYLSTLERLRQIAIGADIGPNGLVEVQMRNNVQLLFDDSNLLAATMPGQRAFVSAQAPQRTRDKVAEWVRNRRGIAVQLEHSPLIDLVDKHIA